MISYTYTYGNDKFGGNTFPCVFFFRELFLEAVHVVHGWFAIQTNLWKVQNTTGRFLAQLHPSNFFFLKSFS